MSTNGKTILVTGATGQQGGAVARHLLGAGWHIRALSRDPAKPAAQALAAAGAEVVQGDLDDGASIARALAGAYGLFSVQNPQEHGPEVEIRQGIALADAAQAAGVRHLVYSSGGGAERSSGLPHMESKWAVEQHIRGLSLPTTILRPVFFMENLQWNRQQIEAGTLSLALRPTTRLQMIAADDIGALAALAFAEPERSIGEAVEIAGDELTMPEAAAVFGKVLGRHVAFIEQPLEQVRSFAPELAETMVWFNEHGNRANIAALRKRYPNLKTLEQWLQLNGWGARAV
jgi:uncharacterized protein YbjT (DUF2867 family)